MPFSKAFEDAYQLAIRPACEAAGAYSERVDQQIFTGSIMERVYNQISKADLIVADMSERNPNVFYEVGYAHALGKTTVLLTKSEQDIPFDLRQYPHVIYGESLAFLKSELERRVRWHVENPASVETVPEELEVWLNGEPLISESEVEVLARGELGYVPLSFAVHNRAERNVRTLSFRTGISTPAALDHATDRNSTAFDSVSLKDKRLFMYPYPLTLLPQEWCPMEVRLSKRHANVLIRETYALEFYAYFDSGAISIPFQVTIQGPAAPLADA
jgi:hypothetical protein